jgi:hypothetical protein
MKQSFNFYLGCTVLQNGTLNGFNQMVAIYSVSENWWTRRKNFIYGHNYARDRFYKTLFSARNLNFST